MAKVLNTFNKAIVELTNACPNEINQSKRVNVRDRNGKLRATFKNFGECI